MLADNELIFGMYVNHHDLQINLEFHCSSLIFRKITRLTLSKFHRWNSFPDFFLYPCRYCADFWHVSQLPVFLKAMHTKTDTFLLSERMIKYLLLLLKGHYTSRNTCSRYWTWYCQFCRGW